MKPLALATCVSALALFGCNEQNQTAASQNQAAEQANAQASAPSAERRASCCIP